MEKFHLDQDEINDLVQDLPPPDLPPLQRRYAIKLLKDLAATIKRMGGDSPALDEAAEHDSVSNCPTMNSLERILLQIAQLSLDTGADSDFIALTDQLTTLIEPLFFESTERYSKAIVKYLKSSFHPTVHIPNDSNLLSTVTQTARFRVFINECTPRYARHAVSAVNGTDVASIDDALAKTTTAAANLFPEHPDGTETVPVQPFPSPPLSHSQNWVLETLRKHIREKLLPTNSAAWFRAMIENPSAHFEPLPGCRAFKTFTGKAGSVAGWFGCNPVIIYYSQTEKGKRNFHVLDPVNLMSGTVPILHRGTWIKPTHNEESQVSYKVTVIPYSFSVNSGQALPISLVGSHLAKRVLGVSGLKYIHSLDQLLVESAPMLLSLTFDPERDNHNLVLASKKFLKPTTSWSNIETFVESLEAYMPHHESLVASLSAKRPLFVALTHDDKHGEANPAHIVGFLVWAFTGQYHPTWSTDWASAAVALLPPTLRPGSDAKAEETGYRYVVNAMLISCVNAVSEKWGRSADEYLKTALADHSEEAAHLIPTSSSLPSEELAPDATRSLAALRLPSMAMNWVHLVFCVMHKIALLPHLVEHPFMFTVKERIDGLRGAGGHIAEQPESRAIAHTVHKALRANDNTLEGALQENLEKLRNNRLPHSVPFILARHLISHTSKKTSAQYQQLHEKGFSHEHILDFFGKNFPALELGAWLMLTSGHIVPAEPLACDAGKCLDTPKFLERVAKTTLAALGCCDEALSKAVEAERIAEDGEAAIAARNRLTEAFNRTENNITKPNKRVDWSHIYFSSDDLYVIGTDRVFHLSCEFWQILFDMKVSDISKFAQPTEAGRLTIEAECLTIEAERLAIEAERLAGVLNALLTMSTTELEALTRQWQSEKTEIVETAKNNKVLTPPRADNPLGVVMTFGGLLAAQALAELAVKIIRYIDDANTDAALNKLKADRNSGTIGKQDAYTKKEFKTLQDVLAHASKAVVEAATEAEAPNNVSVAPPEASEANTFD